MERPEESDQLPEEGPEEYTDDDVAGAKRPVKENPGARDEGDSDPDQATGNPKNAG